MPKEPRKRPSKSWGGDRFVSKRGSGKHRNGMSRKPPTSTSVSPGLKKGGGGGGGGVVAFNLPPPIFAQHTNQKTFFLRVSLKFLASVRSPHPSGFSKNTTRTAHLRNLFFSFFFWVSSRIANYFQPYELWKKKKTTSPRNLFNSPEPGPVFGSHSPPPISLLSSLTPSSPPLCQKNQKQSRKVTKSRSLPRKKNTQAREVRKVTYPKLHPESPGCVMIFLPPFPPQTPHPPQLQKWKQSRKEGK